MTSPGDLHYFGFIVFSSRSRTCLSAFLLLVQVLGLGHVAFAEHALTHDGSVTEVVALANESHHDETNEHLCAGDVNFFPLAEDCAVFASWKAPSLVPPLVVLHSWKQLREQPLLMTRSCGIEPLDVLSRAPKASPPVG